jgi:LTXXQ motif family protein
MNIPRALIPALFAATIPATAALAQAPPQTPQPQAPQAQERQGRAERLSPEVRARLHDGRIAMIKESLKLNEAQLKLWTPVEQQLRTSYAAREQAREARRQRREQRRSASDPSTAPSMADRIDRASRRMTERAQRLAAFNTAFKPFYETLTAEQKQVAGLVLREMRGGHKGHGHRWAMRGDRRGAGPDAQPQPQKQ